MTAEEEYEAELERQGLLFSGRYAITTEWRMTLPAKLRREISGQGVALGRPGIDIYLQAGTLQPGISAQETHEAFKNNLPKNRIGSFFTHEGAEEVIGGYEIMTEVQGRTLIGFIGWAIHAKDILEIQILHEDYSGASWPHDTWASIEYTGACNPPTEKPGERGADAFA